MNITVDDIMVPEVLTIDSDQTVGAAREMMVRHSVHALPIVDAQGHAAGIITSNDMLENVPDDSLVGTMSESKVYTVPRYDGVHVAARVMRNHKIHHIIITDDKKVVGILSAFDLLRLVEDHRFTMKNAPTPSKRKKAGIA